MPFPKQEIINAVLTKYKEHRDQEGDSYHEMGYPLLGWSTKRQLRIKTCDELMLQDFDIAPVEAWFAYSLKLQLGAESGEKRMFQLRQLLQGYILSHLLEDNESAEYNYVTTQPDYSKDKFIAIIKAFNENEIFNDENVRKFLPYSSFEDLQKNINSSEARHDFLEEKSGELTQITVAVSDGQPEVSLVRTAPLTPTAYAHKAFVAANETESNELPLQSAVVADKQSANDLATSVTANRGIEHDNALTDLLLLRAMEPPKMALSCAETKDDASVFAPSKALQQSASLLDRGEEDKKTTPTRVSSTAVIQDMLKKSMVASKRVDSPTPSLLSMNEESKRIPPTLPRKRHFEKMTPNVQAFMLGCTPNRKPIPPKAPPPPHVLAQSRARLQVIPEITPSSCEFSKKSR